jgi:tetratricopeptide (TPR) repeat protein
VVGYGLCRDALGVDRWSVIQYMDRPPVCMDWGSLKVPMNVNRQYRMCEYDHIGGVDYFTDRCAMDHMERVCSFCHKEGDNLKRCVSCKKEYYCDANCQRLAWKVHQITCTSLPSVCVKIENAHNTDKMDNVLRWSSRFDEIVASDDLPDFVQSRMLEILLPVYHRKIPLFTKLALTTDPDTQHQVDALHNTHREIATVYLKQSSLACKSERYRDQGELICAAGGHILGSGDVKYAVQLFQKARGIAETHGFFCIECVACRGLGNCALVRGDTEDALDFLRNALAAALLSEKDCATLEMDTLEALTSSLHITKNYAEARTLMSRFKDLTREDSLARGTLQIMEVAAFFLRIWLHEIEGELGEAAIELRALGELLQIHIKYVTDHAADFLEMLHALFKLKVLQGAFAVTDPILKVWDVYEQVGGIITRTVVGVVPAE